MSAPFNLTHPTITIGATGTSGASGLPASRRSPTSGDDSSLGYKAGDLWQFGGQVWSATSVAKGAAVWEPVPTSGLPGDISGALFAGGALRVVTGYTGPLVDVSTTVSGKATTTTIGQNSSGGLDRGALSTALLAADLGTYATVTNVYNQVAGQGATVVAAPRGPRIGVVQCGTHDAMSWGDNNGPSGLSVSNINIAASNLNVAFLGSFHSTNDAGGVPPTLIALGDSNSPSMMQVTMDSGFTGKTTLANNFRGYSNSVPFSWNAQPSVHTFSFTNSTTYLSSGRDFLDTGLAATGSPMSSMSIGYMPGDSANNPSLAYQQTAVADIHLSAIVIWSQPPSPSTIQAARASMCASMGYTPQARGELVLIGDSRTQGVNTGDGQSWPSQLSGPLSLLNRHNFAVSGATTSNMLSAIPQAATMGRSGEPKIAVVWIGINDGNSNLNTTVANINSIVSQLKAAGFLVAVVDEFIGQNSGNQGLRTAIKIACEVGACAADMEIDPFIAGMPLSDQTNTSFWNANDHIHPNYDAAKLIADMVSTRLYVAASQ